MVPRVKICCIANIEEAWTAIESGASALGLVGDMPSGPGVIPDEQIFRIARFVPPPIGTFLLTSETTVENILLHYQRTFTNTIQIVDDLKTGTYRELKSALPSVKIVQVIHVLDQTSVYKAITISEHVDALLLDSGNPTLDVKVLGGTGKVHDWKLSRKIRESVKIPVFLAGGLNATNIREAIAEVDPFGIDLCNGVRTNGKLDKKKLDEFFKSIPA